MENYKVKAKIKHDNGIINLSFVVSSFEETYFDAAQKAVKQITIAEGCPEHAIIELNLKPE